VLNLFPGYNISAQLSFGRHGQITWYGCAFYWRNMVQRWDLLYGCKIACGRT